MLPTSDASSTRPHAKEPQYDPTWPIRLRDFFNRLPPLSQTTRLRRREGRSLVAKALAKTASSDVKARLAAWKAVIRFSDGDRRLLKHLFNGPNHGGKTALRLLVQNGDAEALHYLRPHIPIGFHYDRDSMAISPCYIGEWQADGFGVLDYSDGSYYTGSMSLSCPNGPGVITEPNGRQIAVIAHRRHQLPRPICEVDWELLPMKTPGVRAVSSRHI